MKPFLQRPKLWRENDISCYSTNHSHTLVRRACYHCLLILSKRKIKILNNMNTARVYKSKPTCLTICFLTLAPRGLPSEFVSCASVWKEMNGSFKLNRAQLLALKFIP